MIIQLLLFVFLLAPAFANAQVCMGTRPPVPSVPLGTNNVFYVATNGNDSNPGTRALPWRTIRKAAATLSAGQTVYIRGGVYREYLTLTRSGTASNRISFVGAPGEVPIIDGRGGPRGYLIQVNGSYITLRGLEIRYATLGGVNVGGDHVALDRLHSHHHFYPGIRFVRASRGLITNNVLHDTYDYARGGVGGGGNGDCMQFTAGGQPAPTNDGDAVIRNNLAYNCSDDGIDTWTTSRNLLEYNIVHNVGFRNASNGGAMAPFGQPAGNGHGFKLGGCSNAARGGRGGCGFNVIRENVSSNNRASGYSNNGGEGNKYFNNSSASNTKRCAASPIGPPIPEPQPPEPRPPEPPQPPGLAAHWKFDEVSGSNASDSSSNANHLTLSGGASFVPGRIGNALSVNGSTGKAVDTNTAGLNSVSALTTAAWIRPTVFPATPSTIVRKGDRPDRGYAMIFFGNRLTFNKINGLASGSVTVPVDRAFHHIATTWSAVTGQIQFYVDGVLRQTVRNPGTLDAPLDTDPVSVGWNLDEVGADAGSAFSGLIDDLRIYHRVLSGAEISAIVRDGGTSTPPVPPAGLFEIGDQVRLNLVKNVRASPSGALIGTQPPGAIGKVTAGPIGSVNGVIWWNIDYETGIDGWTGEDNVELLDE